MGRGHPTDRHLPNSAHWLDAWSAGRWIQALRLRSDLPALQRTAVRLNQPPDTRLDGYDAAPHSHASNSASQTCICATCPWNLLIAE